MSSLVYRFDNLTAFSVLETATTARGPVGLCADGTGDATYLRIALQRQADDPPEITVLIGLPLIAIDGNPERLQLDVLGDASGCRVFLEAGDALGWGFVYSFGEVDFTGWQACSADVQQPTEYWGLRKQQGTLHVVPPVQPLRLGIGLSKSCNGVNIGLRALLVTGEVRLASSGIASSPWD